METKIIKTASQFKEVIFNFLENNKIDEFLSLGDYELDVISEFGEYQRYKITFKVKNIPFKIVFFYSYQFGMPSPFYKAEFVRNNGAFCAEIKNILRVISEDSDLYSWVTDFIKDFLFSKYKKSINAKQ